MRKILSLCLALVLILSMTPAAFAAIWACASCGNASVTICPACGTSYCSDCGFNTCECNATLSSNSTRVEYNADDRNGDGQLDNLAYTITVPALLTPRLDQAVSGTVTLKGMWPSNARVQVTADSKVVLTNSINPDNSKELVVAFETMSYAGNNVEEKTYTAPVSVAAMPADALFGTWSGVFNYQVEMVNEVSLVSFTIDGVEYQAEKNMTWAQWVDSSYNTNEYYVNNYGIFIVSNKNVCRDDGISVSLTDTIIDGHHYSNEYLPS